MKLPSIVLITAALIASVSAGNPSYLRHSNPDSRSGSKTFDFSDVDQVEQDTSSAGGSGSGSGNCPEKCPLDYKPVKDENGVEYLNECLLRLAQCTDSSLLASSDLADVSGMFGSLDGSITLEGSGSKQVATIDIGLLDMFGPNESELDSGSEDASSEEDDTQPTSSFDASGSGSDICRKECAMDNKPVKDENGVEYLNECLLRLAQCFNSILDSSEVADSGSFSSLDEFIKSEGSGSNFFEALDSALLDMVRSEREPAKPKEDLTPAKAKTIG